jgi:hypothetical protein
MSNKKLDKLEFESIVSNNTKKAKANNNASRANNNASRANNNASRANSIINSLGIGELEEGLENLDASYGSILTLNTKTGLSSDKYLKPCGDNEDPYNTTPPKEPEIKGATGDFKTISTNTLVANSGFGLIMPALSLLDMAIFVPKQKRPKCFRKTRKKITQKSVDTGGICYKDSDCKSDQCENSFFGVFEGRCVTKRKTINVEEGGLCANDNECNEGLKCDNLWIGLGQCKQSKKKGKK